jgi:hypothetical protein
MTHLGQAEVVAQFGDHVMGTCSVDKVSNPDKVLAGILEQNMSDPLGISAFSLVKIASWVSLSKQKLLKNTSRASLYLNAGFKNDAS